MLPQRDSRTLTIPWMWKFKKRTVISSVIDVVCVYMLLCFLVLFIVPFMYWRERMIYYEDIKFNAIIQK